MNIHSDDLLANITVWGPEARVAPRMLGWDVPAEELIHIPEHWLKYPEPNQGLHYLIGMLYCGFFVLAIVGNGLVIWIFSSAKSLRTPSNMFVVNLAICDFIMMLKTPIFIFNSFSGGFALGHIGCQIFGFMGAMSGIGAAITNACIAYDRYNVIAKPFDGKMTHGKAMVMLIIVWCYALPWATLPMLEIWGRFVPEGFLTSCTFDYLTITPDTQLFVGTIFTFSYVIPMSLIIYYYSQIVQHVFNHEKALREQAKKMNVESLRSGQSANQQSAEVRIAKAAICICFLFVASWTPYAVVALIGAFGDQSLLTPAVTMIPACTCKAVACLDPYVYAISHPRYRLELQKRVPWLAIKEAAIQSDAGSNVTEATATTPS